MVVKGLEKAQEVSSNFRERGEVNNRIIAYGLAGRGETDPVASNRMAAFAPLTRRLNDLAGPKQKNNDGDDNNDNGDSARLP